MRQPIANAVIIATAGLVLVVWARPAAAKTHPVDVFLYRKDGICDHKVDQNKLKLKKPKDVAIWEIHNDAPGSEQCDEQEVILCSYIKGQPSPNLFEACVSTPVSGVVLNAPFSVKRGEVLRLMCLGKTPVSPNQGNEIVIDNQNIGNNLACPTRASMETADMSKPRPRYHVIDIEIVP